ncbi:hypothetical protein [Paraburkholderia pallida]|uniref:MFS transporter n=1 Tax=Paraburkholderia pallida TaxID=2547399 RepID=A0A4P7CN64_9BURK|nr:hypothetical protein [Paraburkholderia pallida]QBQ97220.1 hypothetical protein E1956_08555 [Paraburkholderia pallida]
MMPKARNTLAAACVWCAVTGAAAALAAGVMLGAMRIDATTAAFAGSAVALAAMALLPAALARRFVSRATVPVAASLILTMAAMTAAAAQARVGSTTGAMPAVLALAGLALLATVRPYLNAPRTESSVPPRQIGRTPIQRTRQGFIGALPASVSLLAPAMLAGLSSGVLARFQFFAVCGAGPFSFAQLAVSLCAVVGFGLLAERIDHRYALLALFALRGALLAALTLDALAPWVVFAAPAFAVLDALTLPTLLRIGRATQAGCPGVAHHMGMLAGAALATTSWGFGQGFPALFFAGAALNFMCACALAARRSKHTPIQHQPHSTQYYASRYTSRPASPALASGGGIDIR